MRKRIVKRYWKYRWDESRGDSHNDWGGSWWYFELSPDDFTIRQIEIYDSGVRLRYSVNHPDDEYGGLSVALMNGMDRPPDQVLTAEEFEAVWSSGPWNNELS